MMGRWELLGVVSFGWRFCQHDLIPAVHASVPQYRDWIESNTGTVHISVATCILGKTIEGYGFYFDFIAKGIIFFYPNT